MTESSFFNSRHYFFFYSNFLFILNISYLSQDITVGKDFLFLALHYFLVLFLWRRGAYFGPYLSSWDYLYMSEWVWLMIPIQMYRTKQKIARCCMCGTCWMVDCIAEERGGTIYWWISHDVSLSFFSWTRQPSWVESFDSCLHDMLHLALLCQAQSLMSTLQIPAVYNPWTFQDSEA